VPEKKLVLRADINVKDNLLNTKGFKESRGTKATKKTILKNLSAHRVLRGFISFGVEKASLLPPTLKS
jgi:hypothetical protein